MRLLIFLWPTCIVWAGCDAAGGDTAGSAPEDCTAEYDTLPTTADVSISELSTGDELFVCERWDYARLPCEDATSSNFPLEEPQGEGRWIAYSELTCGPSLLGEGCCASVEISEPPLYISSDTDER